jgi:hypothetical protein
VVAFDIVGPLPESEKGNKYLLTVVDHFSRYPLAVPVPNRNIKTICEALFRQVVCVFGMPEALLSDREASFVSKVTEGMLALLGIAKLRTSGYQSQANGVVERFHRTMNATMAMFVDAHKSDWEDYIDSILFGYRTSMCTSTGYAPFTLLFGRRATMPPDIIYEVNGRQLREEYARGITVSESVRVAYREARERQRRVAENNRSRRDVGRKDIAFSPGDDVMIWDLSYDKKSPRKWKNEMSGPHKVLKPTPNPQLYWVRRKDRPGCVAVNVNKMRRACLDNGDVGPPLGAEGDGFDAPMAPDREGSDVPPNDVPSDSGSDPGWAVPEKGDMVIALARLCSPDDEEYSEELEEDEEPPEMASIGGMNFMVGKVTAIRGVQIDLRWYCTMGQSAAGVWLPAFIDHTDNKLVYSTSRPTGTTRCTSAVSGHRVSLRSLIWEPFCLVDGRLPPTILDQVGRL